MLCAPCGAGRGRTYGQRLYHGDGQRCDARHNARQLLRAAAASGRVRASTLLRLRRLLQQLLLHCRPVRQQPTVVGQLLREKVQQLAVSGCLLRRAVCLLQRAACGRQLLHTHGGQQGLVW
jgi:hypothetical protein